MVFAMYRQEASLTNTVIERLYNLELEFMKTEHCAREETWQMW